MTSSLFVTLLESEFSESAIRIFFANISDDLSTNFWPEALVVNVPLCLVAFLALGSTILKS